MSSLALTSIIPVMMVLAFLYPIDSTVCNRRQGNFMTKQYTDAIKGMCAIVVIFAHIPQSLSNPLQDSIGYFAYVAVTFFFIVSSYGMMMGYTTNPSYLRNFWRNRLVSLLIPMLFVNIFEFLVDAVTGQGVRWPIFMQINRYIVVLLCYCLWFWIVAKLARRLDMRQGTMITVLALGVAAASITLYCCCDTTVSPRAGWCFEQWGLIWGLLICRLDLTEWFDRHTTTKRIVALLLALVVGMVYVKARYVPVFGDFVLKVALGLLVILTLFVYTYRMNIGNRALTLLGSISYEVYLVQGFILWRLQDMRVSSGVFTLTATFASLIAAWLIHRVDAPLVRRFRSK